MGTPIGERAIEDALAHRNAILKSISPNDVGLTGGHQRGYYLPKAVWKMFTPNPPEKGHNDNFVVEVLWQDGRVTRSTIKWYGAKKSEYRLTGFGGRGGDFPWLSHDCVGDVLVLIRSEEHRFLGYVLHREDDIEEIQASLGIEIEGSWAAYSPHLEQGAEEAAEDCIDRQFRAFSGKLTEWPAGSIFAEAARQAIKNCMKNFAGQPSDDRLLALVEAEYKLFKMAERQLCKNEIHRLFQSVDDFVMTAQSILQRRKKRAGGSLENHVEFLLTEAGIPFDRQPDIDGKPDIVIPGRREYEDPKYPLERLCVVGVKRTCKDRWRQVVREARRVPTKHILTLQAGISATQLSQMHEAAVTLVVPKKLHKLYPSTSEIRLLDVDSFIGSVRQMLT